MLKELSCIFPCDDIEKTGEFYEKKLGFRKVEYLDVEQPHICLYRDNTEIILIKTIENKFKSNHELYGYGYDAYFYTQDQDKLVKEFMSKGVKIVKGIELTDYNNREFVVEDLDGRHIAFGIKEK